MLLLLWPLSWGDGRALLSRAWEETLGESVGLKVNSSRLPFYLPKG